MIAVWQAAHEDEVQLADFRILLSVHASRDSPQLPI